MNNEDKKQFLEELEELLVRYGVSIWANYDGFVLISPKPEQSIKSDLDSIDFWIHD